MSGLRVAVVYYSRNHNTEKVAKAIGKEIEADSFAVKSSHYPLGIRGWLKAGMHALKRTATPIQVEGFSPGNYDLVIVGSPVWAGNVSSPIRSFLENIGRQTPQLAFFTTCGGSGGERVFAEMKAISQKNPVATLEVKARDLASGAYLGLVKGYVSKILESKAFTAA